MTQNRHIAVAARKGGVGKTTLVSALAILLSRRQRVLIVDLDPQCNAAHMLGGDPSLEGTASLLLNEAVEPQQLSPNLHILPGGPELTSISVQRLPATMLKERVSTLTYDVILFDCPPGTNHLEWLALHAATDVLVALDAHPLALIGAGRVLKDVWKAQETQNLGITNLALVLGRLDFRRGLDRQFPQLLRQQWPTVPLFQLHMDTSLAQLATRKQLARFSERAINDLQAIEEHLHETHP